MRIVAIVFVLLVFTSCNEALIDKPENLIPKEKMVEILQELSIVNAAKTTNIRVLHDNGVEPMEYIFDKYDIDSLQLVESDRYYASLPIQYGEIYKEVEAILEKDANLLKEEKEIKDSLKVAKEKLEREKEKAKKANDTL